MQSCPVREFKDEFPHLERDLGLLYRYVQPVTPALSQAALYLPVQISSAV